LMEEAARAQPDVPGWKLRVATCLHNLGSRCQLAGRGAEAEDCFQRALALRESLVGQSSPPHGEAVEGLAGTCINPGLACPGTRPPERALALYRRAEDLLRPIVQDRPEAVEAVLSWTALHCNWGNLAADPKRPAEALAHFDEAVRKAEEVLQREPRYSRARSHG